MLNLVRSGPRLLKLVRVGFRLLNLVRDGRCLLNLVQAGRLNVGGCGSDSALARNGRGRGRYRPTCGDNLVRCDRGAGQGRSSPPSAGLSVALFLHKGNDFVSGTSYCALLASREALHGCMGGDGHGYHHHQKLGQKSLYFLRWQGHALPWSFYVFWFFVNQPRTIR